MAAPKLQVNINTVLELFSSDEEDVALISVFSGAIAYLNAASRPDKGDVCSLEETIIGFLFWCLAVTIYCVRHFVIYRERYRKTYKEYPWMRVVRCTVFCTVLLIINQTPLSCLAPESQVKKVRYVQAAVWTALALLTTNLLGQHIQKDRLDDIAAEKDEEIKRLKEPAVIPPSSTDDRTSSFILGEAQPLVPDSRRSGGDAQPTTTSSASVVTSDGGSTDDRTSSFVLGEAQPLVPDSRRSGGDAQPTTTSSASVVTSDGGGAGNGPASSPV